MVAFRRHTLLPLDGCLYMPSSLECALSRLDSGLSSERLGYAYAGRHDAC